MNHFRVYKAKFQDKIRLISAHLIGKLADKVSASVWKQWRDKFSTRFESGVFKSSDKVEVTRSEHDSSHSSEFIGLMEPELQPTTSPLLESTLRVSESKFRRRSGIAKVYEDLTDD